MNSNYALPASSVPLPRSRPVNTASNNSRESNALRASVLDAALELGIGNNSVVAAWMFDNTVKEEDEEEPVSSPSLTHHSSTASEEGPSFRYPHTPPDSAIPIPSSSQPISGRPIPDWNTHKFEQDVDTPYLPSGSSNGITFPTYDDIPIPPRPTTPINSKKLRKKNKEGYESDGGHLREVAKKVQKKESKARLKEEKREQKEERKRKKSFGSALKPSKKNDESGYDTDGVVITTSSKSSFMSGGKKAKGKNDSTDTGVGYETDAGYASAGDGLKKSKTRFFKLSLKGSRSDLKGEVAARQVPPLPKDQQHPPLPIAERFATSLGAILSPNLHLKLSSPTNSTLVPLPQSSRTELPTIQPSQPMIFETIGTSDPSPSSTTAPPFDRSSLTSAESSSSSQHRQRAFPISPRRENNIGHSVGIASVSTINSSSSSAMTSPAKYPQPLSPISSPKSAARLSSSSSFSNPAAGSLRTPPAISYPITRTASLVGPISPLDVTKNSHPHLPSLDTQSRGVSPMPMSQNTSYVIMTPSPSTASSLNHPSPNHPQHPVISALPTSPTSPFPVRPRNPPVDGFGPRSALASPPAANGGRLSPNPVRTRQLSSLLVPQDSNANGASDVSPVASPSVLAYYELPPPNHPPPMGPLPSVPGVANPPPSNPPPSSHLRSKVLERQRNGNELSMLMGQPIQRGRESPFPSRPVVSPALFFPPEPTRGFSPSPSPVPGYGLEARVKNVRFQTLNSPRDEYADPLEARNVPGLPWVNIVPPSSQASHSDHDVIEDEEEDAEDIRGVLDRFVASDLDESEEGAFGDQPLPARRSFEALREKRESFAVSDYYGPRDTAYGWDANATTAGNRESRWSGSIYSRVSILDPDKSEETRDRFVKRVEAMVQAKKEREGEFIPPVPQIPVGLAQKSAPWNKF